MKKPVPSSQDQDIAQILKKLESIKSQYPSELLAARRAMFIDQISQRTQVEHGEEWTPEDQSVIEHLRSLGSMQVEYPPELLNSRRSAFKRQLAQRERVRLWASLRSALQNKFARLAGTLPMPSMRRMQVSLVLAGIAFAAFAGFLLQKDRSDTIKASESPDAISRVVPIATTSTPEERIICKPGYQPPLCLAKEFDQSRDLTYPGNGSARPAVAKDTMPGHEEIHHPAYINDGLYGPGTSWVSDSPDSWIKIDLGKATTINTVAFGRDRLGTYNDRDPGQFVIALALTDAVYADGDSSNDKVEYKEVFDSKQVGFSGTVSGSETVEAQFQPRLARFVKITFENPGTAIDEVEVFLRQSPVQYVTPTKKPKEQVPASTWTPIPTNTPLPTDTPTPVPTDTPLPTETPTPVPTDTPLPTETPTPVPTDTPLPTETPEPPLVEPPFLLNTPYLFPTDTPTQTGVP
jgi:hypothetical protein